MGTNPRSRSRASGLIKTASRLTEWTTSETTQPVCTRRPQGISGYLLGVDAVREFNVLGHTYGAEYGKRAGAQVTIVTTSGTNQFHGSVFEYLRNDALDTRNFFDVANAPDPTPVPPFQRNQFGGAVGGPIRKDKMFFFGNYEGFRERLAVSQFGYVPSRRARQGLLPNASGEYVQALNL